MLVLYEEFWVLSQPDINPVMVVQACNFSTEEVEAERSDVQSHPGTNQETLSQKKIQTTIHSYALIKSM